MRTPRRRGARPADPSTPDTAAPAGFGVSDEENSNPDRRQSKSIRRRSLRLLSSLLESRRSEFFLAVTLVVLAQAARVAGPPLIAYGIDHALPAAQDGRWQSTALVGGAYVAAAVLAGSCTAGYIRVAARVSQAVLLDLRQRVFRQTQRLSMEFHESYTSGRIISRQTSDLEAVRELLDSGLTALVQGALFMLFTGVTLFALDWRSGLILGIAVLPVYVLTRWFRKRSQLHYRTTRVASARLIVSFVETVTGIRAVQAFRRERTNDDAFGELTEDYRAANARAMSLNGVLDPGLVVIGNLTVAAVLGLGAVRVLEGTMDVGVLLAVVLATKRFFGPVQQMAMFYNAFQSAAAALEKISGLLEEEPSIREPARPVPLPDVVGAVRFDQVSFAYTPRTPVLPGLTLDIPAGQTVAVVGETGSGKSTLAKLLARFYDVTAGRITLDGVDLREIASADLRGAVVMVTQEAYLFSGSVRDNIALAKPTATDEEVLRAASAVGAHDFITDLPDGYDTDLNKRGGRVSAGQRQLISFARAFLADPAVLILDEATSSLDIPGERLVQHGLQTLLADRTAIIIAHRLSTLAIADRVLVMSGGCVVEDGPPAQLIGGSGRFAAMHAAWKDSLV